MQEKNTESKLTKRERIEKHKADLRKKNLSGDALKLVAKERPGYVRRFVNDNPRRVQQLMDMGYELAKDSPGETCGKLEGSKLGVNVGQTNEGPNTPGILMEIPEERYQALQEMKQEKIDSLESEMERGESHRKADDGRYRPGIDTPGTKSRIERR